MSEELIFEIPEVRITTERLVFHEKTFAVDYVASTRIDERTKEWSRWLLAVVAVSVAGSVKNFIFPPFQDYWWFFALCLVVIFVDRLPQEHVLTIKMTDKKFYEVITRTRKEAEIIQGHINDAMERKRENLVQKQQPE
jgi:hypothetical protein